MLSGTAQSRLYRSSDLSGTFQHTSSVPGVKHIRFHYLQTQKIHEKPSPTQTLRSNWLELVLALRTANWRCPQESDMPPVLGKGLLWILREFFRRKMRNCHEMETSKVILIFSPSKGKLTCFSLLCGDGDSCVRRDHYNWAIPTKKEVWLFDKHN